jgi:hypothetical protein
MEAKNIDIIPRLVSPSLPPSVLSLFPQELLLWRQNRYSSSSSSLWCNDALHPCAAAAGRVTVITAVFAFTAVVKCAYNT